MEFVDAYMRLYDGTPIVSPHWMGDKGFHAAHRSNLLRKDPEHYSQFEWAESSDLEYVWPKPCFSSVKTA